MDAVDGLERLWACIFAEALFQITLAGWLRGEEASRAREALATMLPEEAASAEALFREVYMDAVQDLMLEAASELELAAARPSSS